MEIVRKTGASAGEHLPICVCIQYNVIWRDKYMQKVREKQEKDIDGDASDAILDVRKALVGAECGLGLIACNGCSERRHASRASVTLVPRENGRPDGSVHTAVLRHVSGDERAQNTRSIRRCEVEFKSVMPSIQHYHSPDHEEYVKQYYLESLCDGNFITWDDTNSAAARSLVNRMNHVS